MYLSIRSRVVLSSLGQKKRKIVGPNDVFSQLYYYRDPLDALDYLCNAATPTLVRYSKMHPPPPHRTVCFSLLPQSIFSYTSKYKQSIIIGRAYSRGASTHVDCHGITENVLSPGNGMLCPAPLQVRVVLQKVRLMMCLHRSIES